MWVSFNALFSHKQEINYLLCFEYEGKVIDALKERRFFFLFLRYRGQIGGDF